MANIRPEFLEYKAKLVGNRLEVRWDFIDFLTDKVESDKWVETLEEMGKLVDKQVSEEDGKYFEKIIFIDTVENVEIGQYKNGKMTISLDYRQQKG